MGSGILALPYAFYRGGYMLSSIVFILIALAIYKTMKMLFAVADKLQKTDHSYSDLTQVVLGRKYQKIVDILLISL